MAPEKMQFSVIVPAFNRCKELARCLDSLRDCAAVRGGIEVLVVDDHSTDDTVRTVRESYPEVRLFEMPRNVGPSHVRNVGIREACGEFLLFLDSDTRVESPRVFDNAVRWFEAHPDTGTVGGEIRVYEPDQRAVFGRAICANGDSRSVSVPLEPGSSAACDFLATCACFARAAVAREVGGFDPYYGFGGEDKDFGYRIARAGYRNYVCADCAVHHYHSPRGRRADETYRYQKTRMRFVLKNATPLVAAGALLSWFAASVWFHVLLPAKLVRLAAKKVLPVRDNLLGGWFILKALSENLRDWETLVSSRRKNFLGDIEMREFVEREQRGG